MRVLQVINAFHPPYSSGGAAFVAHNISKALAKKGHEVTVFTTNVLSRNKLFCSKQNPNYSEEVKVYYFKNVVYKPSVHIYFSNELVRAIKKNIFDYDVVHVHEYRSYISWVVNHYSNKHKIPSILQAHGQLPRVGSWRRLKWIYDFFFGYRLLKDASKVIALSMVEAEQYRSMGVLEEKIAIIPNGIDLSEYAELPPKGAFKKKFNIPEDKKIILYLGRIHKTKGVDLLVKAYAYLKNETNVKDVVLVIAGPDDGYLNEVKALARSLGVYNLIVFTGFISSEDKLKALVDADVFVTPSFYGFPMTFLEACSVGTPIVTTSLGDTLEWIDGKVGYVTQPTHHDLAKAIYRIISDDKLRRKFSRNCIKVVRSDFSLEKVVERLEKVYEEVVEA